MSDMDLPLAVRMMQDGYLMEIDQLQTENEELGRAAHDLLLVALLLCDPTQCEECKCFGPSTKTCALAQIIERLEELGVEV